MTDEALCNALRYEKWDEAADRIEALTEARDTMGHLWAKEAAAKQVALGRIEELEANLAKLVSIEKRVTSFEDTTEELAECGCARCKAHLDLRALLAEIEGEKT
jgi:hypothetical protein